LCFVQFVIRKLSVSFAFFVRRFSHCSHRVSRTFPVSFKISKQRASPLAFVCPEYLDTPLNQSIKMRVFVIAMFFFWSLGFKPFLLKLYPVRDIWDLWLEYYEKAGGPGTVGCVVLDVCLLYYNSHPVPTILIWITTFFLFIQDWGRKASGTIPVEAGSTYLFDLPGFVYQLGSLTSWPIKLVDQGTSTSTSRNPALVFCQLRWPAVSKEILKAARRRFGVWVPRWLPMTSCPLNLSAQARCCTIWIWMDIFVRIPRICIHIVYKIFQISRIFLEDSWDTLAHSIKSFPISNKLHLSTDKMTTTAMEFLPL
jgi:hypothetical protein